MGNTRLVTLNATLHLKSLKNNVFIVLVLFPWNV